MMKSLIDSFMAHISSKSRMIKFDKNGNCLPEHGVDELVDIIKDRRFVERYEADAHGRIMVVLYDQSMIIFFANEMPVMAKLVAENFTCALDDRIRAAKSRYLSAFETEFIRLWKEYDGSKPDWAQLKEGMWTNAHMHYGLKKASAEAAAAQWFDERITKPAQRLERLHPLRTTPHG